MQPLLATAASLGLVTLASAQNPHYPIYCKSNGHCHVPGLPDHCSTDNDCVTPWYNSYCQSGGQCHLLPPPTCKTDADCKPKGVDEADLARHVEVARINALPGITWKAKVHDRFRGQPLGAAKSLCGVQKDAHEKLLASVSAGKVSVFKHDPAVELPEAFDSEANWPKCAKVIGDIRDQSACGCCWGEFDCLVYAGPDPSLPLSSFFPLRNNKTHSFL